MDRFAVTPRRPAVGHLPSVLLLVLLAAMLAGCLPGGDERNEQLAAVARWEDRRLAPHDSLATMLAAPDAHVRLAAVRAAGLIGRNDALPRMLDLLEDPSLTVRRQTLFSLGLLADTLAVPALETATKDAHPGVRLAALRGLAHVPNRGAALLAATADEPELAAAAWDALRNQAERVPRSDLLRALKAGLVHQTPDVQWRVLRCTERLPDSTLVPLVVPYARSDRDQIRVHAYRALARLGGADARAAVLATAADHDFRGRDMRRVDIAACRALGALATDAPPEQMPALTTHLIERAGDPHPHVATVALDALTACAADRPLPDEAVERESLLPVWRIRAARAAREHLDDPEVGVRSAAVGAWAALRGRGALVELEPRLHTEPAAQVMAALVSAVGDLCQDPDGAARPFIGSLLFDAAPDTTAAPHPWLRDGLVAAAAVDAVATNDACDPHRRWQILVDTMMRATMPGATDAEQVLAATALGHLGAHPDGPTARGVINVAERAAEPWRSDLRLAALECLQEMFAAPDSVWTPGEATAATARTFLSGAFDDPDVRIRQAARETAVATGLLPAALVPTAASLQATLPAVVRDPIQPPVTLPFDAPRVRCTTARGEFVIALAPDVAPNTCAMFLDLVDKGFYDGLIFHRVVPDFVVQGGDPTGTGWGGPGYTIRSEWSDLPYTRGRVGIAHSGKDSGGCQWFVTLSEQPHLVGRYTIFGEVTKGMEVLDGMQPGDTFSLTVVP